VIPAAYREAVNLDTDARAILALARLLWDGLSLAERRLLLDADSAGWLTAGRKRDRNRLLARGYAAGPSCGLRLTRIGALVREVGYSAGGAS